MKICKYVDLMMVMHYLFLNLITDKTLNSTTEENDDEMEDDSPKKKFNWEQTITEVLKSKGELSLKKLKKKV